MGSLPSTSAFRFCRFCRCWRRTYVGRVNSHGVANMHYQCAARLPEALRFRVPRGLPAAIQTAARRHHSTGAEWVRQTLLRGLESEGLRLVDGEIERIKPEGAR